MENRCNKAFTLIELLLTLIITGLVLGMLTLTFSNYLKDLRVSQVTLSGTTYPLAPAWGELKDAVDLQFAFKEDLKRASSVFVLGDKIDSDLQKKVDGRLSSIKITEGETVGITSSKLFLHSLKNTKDAGEQDFTVFLLGPSASADYELIAVAAVRSDTSINSDYRVYTVTYESKYSRSYSYEFAINETAVNAYKSQQDFLLKVGARHFYARNTDKFGGIDEEMGSFVVFPDPTAVAYAVSGSANTFSRFIYFLPVKK